MIGTLISIFIVSLPFVLIAGDIVLAVKKKKSLVFELTAFSLGLVYMVFAYMLWELPGYAHPINIYGTENAHEPFNVQYFGAVCLFMACGFISYLVLKFCKRKLAPIVEVFLISGMYVGMILCGVWIFQLACGTKTVWIEETVIFGTKMDGMVRVGLEESDYFFIFWLCVVPVIFVLHCIKLLMQIVKEKAKLQEKMVYENMALNGINRLLCKGAGLLGIAVVGMLPVLGILVVILILFGQQPDSVILAFTKTSDWILSGEISPPPVAYDTHYLCTVSLRGHKKLVKPIRYGIRRGEKIVVNRQLCVANAFEQLIQERSPRFHRAVRNFYDAYGYPISKHINSAWSADVVYLLMKPLEWVFLFVLYLCDPRPEDRICSQYLPKKE